VFVLWVGGEEGEGGEEVRRKGASMHISRNQAYRFRVWKGRMLMIQAAEQEKNHSGCEKIEMGERGGGREREREIEERESEEQEKQGGGGGGLRKGGTRRDRAVFCFSLRTNCSICASKSSFASSLIASTHSSHIVLCFWHSLSQSKDGRILASSSRGSRHSLNMAWHMKDRTLPARTTKTKQGP
jgi:hypothetical protein